MLLEMVGLVQRLKSEAQNRKEKEQRSSRLSHQLKLCVASGQRTSKIDETAVADEHERLGVEPAAKERVSANPTSSLKQGQLGYFWEGWLHSKAELDSRSKGYGTLINRILKGTLILENYS